MVKAQIRVKVFKLINKVLLHWSLLSKQISGTRLAYDKTRRSFWDRSLCSGSPIADNMCGALHNVHVNTFILPI